ncbi:YqiA/YcfP family alpha/beta fold hydrolase [uncultured Parabacteroides sp.]|uniref:YqiA/YcfP family alpha/beta fold hydrolase n=1 Tax=uncultured Parabacteroides sp. TaxID=512312 RepID=UPI002587330E|nr:YqiA/YcfP family alpha/beta fold hydrolase [uncultured Parabacteroides sp.]
MCTTFSNKNDVKPVAIYVHGLGSGAASTTVRMVCKIFSEYEWIAIEVNENPFESVEKINATVSKFNPSLLMGTSLGGYYVFYADAPCATKVICNPAMNIAKLIRYKIGFGTYSYFVERQDGNTEYTLDEAVCRRFTEYESSHKVVNGTKNYALFAVHDELIGDADMLDNMAMVFESGYRLLLDSKGGHRLRAAAMNLLHREISK